MRTTTSVCLLIVSFGAVFSFNISEYYINKFKSNYLSILTPANIRSTVACLNPQASDAQYYLYTRNNLNQGIVLNTGNLLQLSTRSNTIILIHGWLVNANSYGFSRLKNEYLKRYDCNLIILDWSRLSQLAYPISVCYLPKISQMVANFLCHRLSQQLQMNLNTVHLVGHSLGAQLSGMIGQRTLTTCRQMVGRITGLDPAGPLFQNLAISQRLDKSDANFVDVVHTNQGVLGYFGNSGHVDFYVNCGTYQPGCGISESIEATICDHRRAVDYMTESIGSNSFQAKPCRNCPNGCTSNTGSSPEISFGENCPRNVSGGYIFYTN